VEILVQNKRKRGFVGELKGILVDYGYICPNLGRTVSNKRTQNRHNPNHNLPLLLHTAILQYLLLLQVQQGSKIEHQ